MKISITKTIRQDGTLEKLDSISDVNGKDITDVFFEYCRKNNLTLNDNDSLASACIDFMKENANILPGDEVPKDQFV